MDGLQAPLRPPARLCMPRDLSSGLAAHLDFETCLMHSHDSCSWTALKALHIVAAIPAKESLGLGNLEAHPRSAKAPSKFGIYVFLSRKFAYFQNPYIRKIRSSTSVNRPPASSGLGSRPTLLSQREEACTLESSASDTQGQEPFSCSRTPKYVPHGS